MVLATGLTLASVSRYPARRIDVVEPEPAVAQAARLFDSYTRNVLGDSRVHLIFGDGRNRLLAVPKQYDVVIRKHPICGLPVQAQQASREFYRIVGARLNPGGHFVQSIRTEGLLPDDLDYLAATFHSVFPHMQIWTSSPGNLILLGYARPGRLGLCSPAKPLRANTGRGGRPEFDGHLASLRALRRQVLGESESDAFTREVDEFNTDDRPALEFALRALCT